MLQKLSHPSIKFSISFFVLVIINLENRNLEYTHKLFIKLLPPTSAPKKRFTMEKGNTLYYHGHIISNIDKLDLRKDNYVEHRLEFLK